MRNATFALALSGASYAAIKANAVGAKQIKANAVRTAEIQDGAVGTADIADGAIADVDLADNSVGSAKIADGSVAPGDLSAAARGPTAYARVQADGSLEPGTATGSGPAQFKGVDQVDIQHPAAGTYCFGGLGFDVASAVVSMDNAGAAATTTQVAGVAIQRGANLGGCDADHQQARVVILNVDPALAAAAAQDARFMVWFQGG